MEENLQITLHKEAEYKFQSRLRRPLLLPISDDRFFEVLEDEYSGYNLQQNNEKMKNLKTIFKGIKKSCKLIKIEEALKNSTKNYAELGRKFKVSRQEMRAMDQRLQKQGSIIPNMTKKPKKLKNEHLEFLKTLMENPANCFLRLSDMKELLISKFKLKDTFCSIYTIFKALEFLRITYKKVIKFTENRNKESTKKQRKIVAKQILSSINRGHEIVFIDEVGFNQNLTPLYEYAESGKRCSVVSSFKSNNFLVIAATTSQELLCLQIFKSSVKSEDFSGFIANLTNYLNKENPGNYI